MARVAIVRGGVVDTVVVADSAGMFDDPVWADWLAGAEAVLVPPQSAAGPGWLFDQDGDPQFSAPPAPDED